MLKNIRDKDNEKSKKWSKDHGSDIYGKTEVKCKQEKKRTLPKSKLSKHNEKSKKSIFKK